MQLNWRPTAEFNQIKQRALLLDNIRAFFKNLAVLEVETPLLCQYAPTMVHIDPISVMLSNNSTRFLQTSPEYAMKRLLAAGIGDIFQICKAFRGMESGVRHNPEFTMLEWYRVNFNHHQLMQEVIALLNYCGINYKNCLISYREIFKKYVNTDPGIASLTELKQIIKNNINLTDDFKSFMLNQATIQDCQELLFSNLVEPNLEHNIIWAIYNYPKEQSALAKVSKEPDGYFVAERFEIYINGIELANGYHELLDPIAQQQRFIEDQNLREQLGKNYLAIDNYLIEALKHGLPSCSGVALGVDRLLMLITGMSNLEQVLCFPWDIA